jgi:hypothetical protein
MLCHVLTLHTAHQNATNMARSVAKPTSKHLNAKTENQNLPDPGGTSKQKPMFTKFCM